MHPATVVSTDGRNTGQAMDILGNAHGGTKGNAHVKSKEKKTRLPRMVKNTRHAFNIDEWKSMHPQRHGVKGMDNGLVKYSTTTAMGKPYMLLSFVGSRGKNVKHLY